MQEAFSRGAFEGVMRNYRGELAECATSNLFIVKSGEALTPPLDAGLLPASPGNTCSRWAKTSASTCGEQTLRDEDLFGADEAFLTSTTRELVPIVRVDDHAIGAGRPGPITKTLLAGDPAYRARTK